MIMCAVLPSVTVGTVETRTVVRPPHLIHTPLHYVAVWARLTTLIHLTHSHPTPASQYST